MTHQTKIEYRNKNELVASIGNIETDQLLLCVDDAIHSEYSSFIERIKQLPNFEALLVTKQGEATKTIFVASSLLRGVPWSVVPTTLLSMVDASIGGKTAVNSKNGKNLIGAFHLPENVWIDNEFLNPEHFQSGLGEIVKYGILNSLIHKSILENTQFSEILKQSAIHKQNLVEIDFKETGDRKSLNVGHTIGHALERVYAVPHGIAVYWGIYLEHLLFDRPEIAEVCLELGKTLSIDTTKYPIPTNLNIEAITELMSKDKKLSSKNNLTFAICSEVGKCGYPSLELADLPKLLKAKLTK